MSGPELVHFFDPGLEQLPGHRVVDLRTYQLGGLKIEGLCLLLHALYDVDLGFEYQFLRVPFRPLRVLGEQGSVLGWVLLLTICDFLFQIE